MNVFREEYDALGSKRVPIDAYYGVQTLRAFENFRITGTRVHPEMIRSMVEIKLAAALTNEQASVLAKEKAEAIIDACKEILGGKYLDNFIVDSIQGGAGTSLNMNANEVIANRAIELLGGHKGDYSVVHPNDHVNCGQSTNDVYPSAGRIALIRLLYKNITELEKLHKAFSEKAEEFAAVLFGENGGRYVIISKTGFDLSALCKEFNKVLSGRGGGRNGIVQGSVSFPEKAEKFLKEISF